MGEGTLSIRQLAEEVGVSSKTLRYWESQGLIAPAGRTHTNYRRYTKADLERVLFIRKAQSLGFTLAEIRQIFDLARSRQAPCDAVIQWAGDKARALEGQIRMLQDLKARLERYRRRWAAEKKPAPLGPNEVCQCIESVPIQDLRITPISPSRNRR
ncbi:MAG: MerR family transcriptional regulator [Candidatus Methylomirabilales bacterium]